MHSECYVFAAEKACRSLRSGEMELWTLTVQLRNLPRGLKYGPNARYARLDNRPAKDMLNTLEQDPESFVLKNNGVMVVADSIRVDGSSVELMCNELDPDDDGPGHGVLNGGHTYKVLEHVLDSEDGRYEEARSTVRVLITVAIGIADDDIWLISRARNTSEKVPLHALRELAGDWSLLKRYLPQCSRTRVAFKPNDPEAPDAEYDTTDLVRRLTLLNNDVFPAQQGAHPVEAYASIGSLVRKFKPQRFTTIAPLLPDALRLEELVVKQWEKINGRGAGKVGVSSVSGCSRGTQVLLSGYTSSLVLADPFVLPVVAAFRVFVKNGAWVKPLEELWEKYGPKTVMTLWEAYREQGRSSPSNFGRSKSAWAAVCDLTKSAAIQMGILTVE